MDAEDPSVIAWEDPSRGVTGWLAMDGPGGPLRVGGFRVQRGLGPDTLARLARAMTLKQRLLGIGAGGAKCGLDLDPGSPHKEDGMRGFLRWLRPWLLDRYSMGPDLGTTFAEIESLARCEGIPSVKIAAGRAQGLDDEETLARIDLLSADVAGHSLGARRAGHGLANAALAVLERLGVRRAQARVGILGFGSLGRGTALALAEAGVPVVAVGDLGGVLFERGGLPVPQLVEARPAGAPWNQPAGALLELRLDVLVLAGSEDMVPMPAAEILPASAVVVGANLGLSERAEAVLHARGLPVVPDFVGGAGGSASMDALFGPRHSPSPREVLEGTGVTMRSIAARVLDLAETRGVTPREAALTICATNAGRKRPRPYGGAPPGDGAGSASKWPREVRHAHG